MLLVCAMAAAFLVGDHAGFSSWPNVLRGGGGTNAGSASLSTGPGNEARSQRGNFFNLGRGGLPFAGSAVTLPLPGVAPSGPGVFVEGPGPGGSGGNGGSGNTGGPGSDGTPGSGGTPGGAVTGPGEGGPGTPEGPSSNPPPQPPPTGGSGGQQPPPVTTPGGNEPPPAKPDDDDGDDGGCNGGGEQKSSGSHFEVSAATPESFEEEGAEEKISEQEISEPPAPAPEPPPAKPVYFPEATADPVDPAQIAETPDTAVEELPGA